MGAGEVKEEGPSGVPGPFHLSAQRQLNKEERPKQKSASAGQCHPYRPLLQNYPRRNIFVSCLDGSFGLIIKVLIFVIERKYLVC